MRARSHPLLIALAAAPLGLGVVTAVPAGATSAPASTATTCTSLTAKLAISVDTGSISGGLSGCTPATTRGSGKLVIVQLIGNPAGNGALTITWANHGTTTATVSLGGTVHVRGCPATSAGTEITGKVTASTGAASGVHGAIKVKICIASAAKPGTSTAVTLVPGSVATF